MWGAEVVSNPNLLRKINKITENKETCELLGAPGIISNVPQDWAWKWLREVSESKIALS